MQRVNRAAKQYAARRRDPTRRYTRRIPRPIMSTVATPRSVRPTRVRTVSAVRKSTWRTRGYMGAFKPAKRTSGVPISYAKTGSIFQKDVGGHEEGNDTVYVGHGTGIWRQVHAGVWRAVLRTLLTKSGISFTNWKQDSFLFQHNGKITVYYYPKKAPVPPLGQVQRIASQFVVYTGATYDDVAVEIMNKFYLDIQVGGYDDFQVDMVELVSDQSESRIYANTFKLHFDIESKLAIQNRTLAYSGGVDGDGQLAGNVENNPLEGRMYLTGRNGFVPLVRDEDINLGYHGFFARSDTGLIAGDGGTQEGGIAEGSLLIKPPPASFFRGTQKTAKVTLAPGQIKRSIVRTVKSISLCNFFTMFQTEIAINGNAIYTGVFTKAHTFGDSAMFAFEKTLNTGAGQAEPPISLGYEINFKVCVGASWTTMQHTAVVNDAF